MLRFWCFCFFVLSFLFASPAWADRGFDSAFAIRVSEAYTTQSLGGKSHYGGYAVGMRGGFLRS